MLDTSIVYGITPAWNAHPTLSQGCRPDSGQKKFQIKIAKIYQLSHLGGSLVASIRLKYWIERSYPQSILDEGLSLLFSFQRSRSVIQNHHGTSWESGARSDVTVDED
jgi:hypothetical protein